MYQSDSGPGAINFRGAIAPDAVFYTNEMLLGELIQLLGKVLSLLNAAATQNTTLDATNTLFFTLCKSIGGTSNITSNSSIIHIFRYT